jgi:phenylpyruvate tautomerase PptA (4-oxalocrotonate tautomerase family)
MPLITFTLQKGQTAAFKQQVGEAVHQSLIKIGVPADDRFQRFIELEAENLIYSRTYPDLQEPRTSNLIIIEILFSVGRSVKVKKQLLGHLIEGLQALGIAPNDVFVVFKETAWENWAFAGGQLLHT